ncbi:hypothetical protein AB0L30_07885 [Microbispora rosea]|uniref:fibronectin type III domain-containing protein n=1 Tax=Microbispora rosea TaxID=58117 RepID=UPI00342CEA25
MTRVRRLGTTAMIVLMALASTPMIGAAPAYAADAEILSPADGAVVKSSGAVAVSAKTDWYQISMALYVEGPSLSRQKIASGGANETISGSFDPGDAPNGTFTVSLFGEVTHKTYATSTFVLSRPPEAPSGVQAQLKNPSTILVRWAKGAEPDLQSYEIASVKAGRSGSVSADSACSGSSCQTSMTLPASMAGQKVDVSVRAFRSDGTGGTVVSQRSAAAYVTVPAPKPSPSPSPKPSKKPGQSGVKSPAAETPKTHQSTAVPNAEPALPKDATRPRDTELPKDTELTLPEANGGSDQTEPVVVPEKTDDPKMTAQSSFLPLGGLSFGVYVALAVVLLLTGANLGAWLRRKGLTSDNAGEGRSGGSEPRPAAGRTGASPEAATVASGVAAFSGAATAKARGNAPVRRPSVILARPKPRENLPEADADTETRLDAVTSTAEGTDTIPGAGMGTIPSSGANAETVAGAGVDTIAGAGAGAATVAGADTDMRTDTDTDTATTVSGQEPAVPAEGEPPVRATPDWPASLPSLTARPDEGGRRASAHESPSPAVLPGQMPVISASAMPAGTTINDQMQERPLRQPEPDVWTEDDDSLYSGRHHDL